MQNTVVKAGVNLTKLLEKEPSISEESARLGSVAIDFLGHANKLINNKRKELHKCDLDYKYHPLSSPDFEYTDMLYGNDINKNIKDVTEFNRLKRIGRGYYYTSDRGHGGGRGFPGFRGRGRAGRGRGARGRGGRGFRGGFRGGPPKNLLRGGRL